MYAVGSRPYARSVQGEQLEHDRLPGWMELAPLVGSAVLAVPVAAQRDFRLSALVLVGLIVAIAAADFRRLLPSWVCTPAVFVCVYFLLRSSDSSDIAPFYLVALTAASAASRPPRQSLVVSGVSAAVLAAAWVWYPDTLAGIVIWIFGIALAHVGGAGVRAQARLAAELEAAQEGLASRAAEDERQRIAREVHDVLAHSLTVTMLHLTGARLALESGDIGEAAEALREAETLGLASLADVRRVVGVLGSDAAVAPPQPDASKIPNLIDDYYAAGMDVDLHIEGDLAELTPATGLGLYRIVQEALANVGRHTSGSAATVKIVATDVAVAIEITNELPMHHALVARGTAEAHRAGGLGVSGMKARAEALGGELTAGPSSDGRWVVAATIPTSPR